MQRRSGQRWLWSGWLGCVLAGSVVGQSRWEPARVLVGRSSAGLAHDVARDRTVVFGGLDATGATLGDTWEFDGAVWERRASSGPAPRYAMAMAYDSVRRETVLFGGYANQANSGETWTWNGERWRLRSPAVSPSPRGEARLAMDTTRGVLVLQGGYGTTFLTDTWEWDGTQWTFAAASGPAVGGGQAMSYDSLRQRMVVYRATSLGQPGQTWEFAAGAWQLRSVNSPGSWFGAALAFDPSLGRTVLTGGSANGAYGGTWTYDGATWTAASGAEPGGRAGAAMVYDPRRARLVLWGGAGTSGGNLAHAFPDTWVRTGSVWSQLAEATEPPARREHAAAADPLRGTVVVHGGVSNNQPLGLGARDDTWLWDGRRWQPVVGAGPGPAASGAMAFDPVSQSILWFGGVQNGLPLSATWSFAGSWTQRQPATVPTARHGHAMVTDQARQRVVLFGGNTAWLFVTAAAPLADTWEWDGANWLQRTPAAHPAARYDHAMAEDRARQRVVLSGGRPAGTGHFADTWEWDGTNWSLRAASGVGARAGHTMAFDPGLQRVVVVGDSAVAATMQWNGTAWSVVATPQNPPPRDQAVAVEEPRRGRLLMFGGQRSAMTAETWWFGALQPQDQQVVGTPCPGPDGPWLAATEGYFPSDRFRLELLGASPGAPLLFGWSFGQGATQVGACTVWLLPPMATEFVLADPAGVARSSIWNVRDSNQLRGLQVFTQAAVLEPAAANGLAFTPLRRITMGD